MNKSKLPSEYEYYYVEKTDPKTKGMVLKSGDTIKEGFYKDYRYILNNISSFKIVVSEKSPYVFEVFYISKSNFITSFTAKSNNIDTAIKEFNEYMSDFHSLSYDWNFGNFKLIKNNKDLKKISDFSNAYKSKAIPDYSLYYNIDEKKFKSLGVSNKTLFLNDFYNSKNDIQLSVSKEMPYSISVIYDEGDFYGAKRSVLLKHSGDQGEKISKVVTDFNKVLKSYNGHDFKFLALAQVLTQSEITKKEIKRKEAAEKSKKLELLQQQRSFEKQVKKSELYKKLNEKNKQLRLSLQRTK